MSTVAVLEPVPIEQKEVLARLLQLYLYDFTEFEPRPLDADGKFSYRYLDEYWAPAPGESRFAYFIRAANGELAGFVMVRVVNGVNVIAEFHVLRQYRRGGVGTAAAKLVFGTHRGPWLVHEVAPNLPAQAFWRRAIDDFTGGHFEQVQDHDGALTQRFTTQLNPNPPREDQIPQSELESGLRSSGKARANHHAGAGAGAGDEGKGETTAGG